MPDHAKTWDLIHGERAALAQTLDGLAPEQWGTPALCAGWSVQLTAAHVVAGAEQTPTHFMTGMVASGFRFNTMMDRAAHRIGAERSDELIARLRATTTTTNHPPAPVVTMLGEIVVHGEDIRRPLGLAHIPEADATRLCLETYKTASFPVGTKKRIAGLRLVATDVGWSHGDGPDVSGPGLALLLAMTGRAAGVDELAGAGVSTLRARLGTPAH